jgi:peptide chain release factor subunit 1
MSSTIGITGGGGGGGSGAAAQGELDKNIERFRVKKLIKSLECARGLGTSVITLLVPPGTQVSQVTQKLTDELGACSNIKSHTNKVSVQTAITATIGRLKTYTRLPPNGLILFCGTVLTEDGKEKKITMSIEPFKAVSRSMYQCDSRFHTEELHRMLESDDKYGFVVIDGGGTLWATVSGSVREHLGKISVELPKKHGRGGQSKNRFARIRMEKRHNYVRKVAELCTQYFITNDRPNIAGLVLAGSAEFKEVLFGSDIFDPRLKAVVMKVVDIAHPGEMGLNQAIEQSADSLGSVKLVQEKKLLLKFLEEIATDSELYCFGVADTIKCIEMGAAATVIVYEDLDINRYVLTPSNGGAPTILFMTEKDYGRRGFRQAEKQQSEDGQEITFTVENENVVDWMALSYQKWGCTLEIVSNKTQEGAQFVRGFGGCGGLLRYKVNLVQLRDLEEGGQAAASATTATDFDAEDDFM